MPPTASAPPVPGGGCCARYDTFHAARARHGPAAGLYAAAMGEDCHGPRSPLRFV
jgi:hypothetical protein